MNRPSEAEVKDALEWARAFVVYDPSTNKERKHPQILAAALENAEAELKLMGEEVCGSDCIRAHADRIAAERSRDEAIQKLENHICNDHWNGQRWERLIEKRDEAKAELEAEMKEHDETTKQFEAAFKHKLELEAALAASKEEARRYREALEKIKQACDLDSPVMLKLAAVFCLKALSTPEAANGGTGK